MKVAIWRRRLALALFFVIAGGLAVLFAVQIPETGFQNEYDPGPRVVPLLMGAVLILGGLAEGVRSSRREEDVSPDAGLGAFWVLLAALTLYALVMPYSGFALATVILTVFVASSMGVRWWVAGMLALGLVAVVYLLFVYLFRVPLPQGVLGLPF